MKKKKKKKIYDWEIVQCDEYGIFIQNDFFVSKYYDVADALKYLKLHNE